MRNRFVATVVAAVLALGARDAAAQGEGPRKYCPTDVPMGCFAMAWEVTPLVPPVVPGGGSVEWHSLVTLRIRNLAPFGAPLFTVQGVTLMGEEYESGPGRGVFVRTGQPASTEGDVGISPDGLVNMEENTGALGQGGTWSWLGPGIVGCQDLGDDPSLDWNYRTCAAEGQTGWVRLDFFVTLAMGTETGTVFGPATPNDIYLALFGNDGEGGKWLCTWAGADIPDDLGERSPCTPLPYRDLAVVPEPGTVVLVGTGLAGLLGVGFRGRRRQVEAGGR